MRSALPLVGLVLLAAPVAGAQTTGRTTLETRVAGGDRAQGFSFLRTAPGEPARLREDLGVRASSARAASRRSLAYFVQLSDFQLADEESPARVEFSDQTNALFGSAWRPQEALAPWTIDASIKQVNAHGRSPHRQGDGSRAALGFAILTGDNADNQHQIEHEWVARLLEGGRIDPNTGSGDPAVAAGCAGGSSGVPGAEEAARYTGVQDYDDYYETTAFYDPDVPAGQYAGWPAYPGLMDRAQQPFDTPGLRVPSYVALGNHDSLVQGNEDAIGPIESVAVGCTKVMGASLNFGNLGDALAATLLTSDPSKTVRVPPDPRRRFVTKPEIRRIFAAGRQADAHGFAFVDPAELAASRGAASYFDFAPRKGLRFIAVDTISEGGVAGPSADGNVDDPQYLWLQSRLEAATAANELVVVFSHHGPTSLTSTVPDEGAQGCQTPDRPEDDPNPGCDLDPRPSTPLHGGDSMVALLHRYPHVVAWVAGHSHVNDVAAYKREGGGGLWVIRTSAEADWPHQDRLLEIMDNRDGTLSILGTLIDNAAPVAAPAPGTPAAGMSGDELAALARTLGFNDPQGGGGTGEGGPEDHNVELVLSDPRKPGPGGSSDTVRVRARLRVTVSPRRVRAGRRTRLRIRVTSGGKAVRGVRIRLGARRARTDRRGRARLVVRLRRAGTVRLRVSRAGYRPATARVRVLRRRG